MFRIKFRKGNSATLQSPVRLINSTREIKMRLFDLFGTKKKESAMDVFIRAVYGDPHLLKRAKLSEAVELASEHL